MTDSGQRIGGIYLQYVTIQFKLLLQLLVGFHTIQRLHLGSALYERTHDLGTFTFQTRKFLFGYFSSPFCRMFTTNARRSALSCTTNRNRVHKHVM